MLLLWVLVAAVLLGLFVAGPGDEAVIVERAVHAAFAVRAPANSGEAFAFSELQLECLPAVHVLELIPVVSMVAIGLVLVLLLFICCRVSVFADLAQLIRLHRLGHERL